MVRPEHAVAVAKALLQYGETLKTSGEKPGIVTEFTPDHDANQLLFADPNAMFFGILFDQGIKAERAWSAPYHLKNRVGHLDVFRLAEMDEDLLVRIIAEPPALHRYINKMAKWVKSASRTLARVYGGSAENIWNDNPTMLDLISRFQQFEGIGQKKASMAANLLRTEVGISMRLTASSQVSYDVHVSRVFLRTGLTEEDSERAVQSAARSLSPEDPGALDLPAWWIGREWCRPASPNCAKCPINGVCPQIL